METKQLHFTREQICEILDDFRKDNGGIQEVLKLCIEILMKSERELHNEQHSDVSNGYRIRKTYGKGRILELRVPRTRYEQFYPVILTILKEQEEECRKLAFSLYGAGLTTQQVGEIFEKVYGVAYSTSQISRMFDYARADVKQWLERPLLAYYPMVMIDATFIYTRRGDSVSKEGYYTILAVKPDRTREVLAIVNSPTESASGWESVFQSIKQRGVKEIGLIVCDDLPGIEDAIWKHYPQADIQLCVVHLKRNIEKHIKPKHRAEVSNDLQKIFKAGDSQYSYEKAQQEWMAFCEKWKKLYPFLQNKNKTPHWELYFTYLKYDYRIQSMLYSTNWIERLNKEYKRTTRFRGALPNPESVLLLLGYVAMHREAYLRKIPLLNLENKKFRWEN